MYHVAVWAKKDSELERVYKFSRQTSAVDFSVNNCRGQWVTITKHNKSGEIVELIYDGLR